ncbi:MAG: hypothetical protein B6D57_01075 [Candidatus Coatesbacteria bacterium 4484_99]|uniref:Putative regulatory protein FmdB zinc ribbon domain-containing protein n=1 Tax=Candidatus Coatesbacteria bacterium 4484_99 TaxID=1970774 RepID=A0A1W9S2K5_9BACT|nr:MAG: hypothetical protein B6D57_01075 [Candidatus Coatesbacteria bacterium 4484_99]RLC41806.1 MAG: zinc ribbon domain-containing protein [Candidatus Coatesbacteria bacterium]RLC42827.1 MAG: zinc ribbon domain-containing protein [Candidatus Coatesbacteria bacterium]RLC44366.1 MAG: zinc ribbon domain-containing protein [Candidatus Coatesbacteria bacterium]
MPYYVFKCEKCGHKFEKLLPLKSGRVRKCPICGGMAKRIIEGNGGLIFKGSGFYITENRSEEYKEKEREERESLKD